MFSKLNIGNREIDHIRNRIKAIAYCLYFLLKKELEWSFCFIVILQTTDAPPSHLKSFYQK
ncbi:hypothetical protein CCAND95_10152 [Capnocytophaga canis]|nr:hypothetical protein CCAND95_10152 [Capnocytophaga canis]